MVQLDQDVKAALARLPNDADEVVDKGFSVVGHGERVSKVACVCPLGVHPVNVFHEEIVVEDPLSVVRGLRLLFALREEDVGIAAEHEAALLVEEEDRAV